MNRNALLVVGLAIPIVVIITGTALIKPNRGLQLLNAAEAGDLTNVQFLVQHGATINYANKRTHGFTPLIGAVVQRQTNVVYYLVDSGADVNKCDENGVTPLMWSTYPGNESIGLIRYLLAHGADVRIKDHSGMTVLQYVESDPSKGLLAETLKAAQR